MDGLPVIRRRRILLRIMVAVGLLGAAACSTGSGGGATGTVSPATTTAPATPTATGPVTAEISQFRDNYSKQIIEIQLTNTTGSAVTVLGAELTSPLFAAAITWPARTGGVDLPPGQTKSLPAPLPTPECGGPAPTQGAPGSGSASGGGHGHRVRLPPAGAVPRRCAGPSRRHGPGGRPIRRPDAEQFRDVPDTGGRGCGHDPAGSGPGGRRGRADRRRASSAAAAQCRRYARCGRRGRQLNW